MVFFHLNRLVKPLIEGVQLSVLVWKFSITLFIACNISLVILCDFFFRVWFKHVAQLELILAVWWFGKAIVTFPFETDLLILYSGFSFCWHLTVDWVVDGCDQSVFAHLLKSMKIWLWADYVKTVDNDAQGQMLVVQLACFLYGYNA